MKRLHGCIAALGLSVAACAPARPFVWVGDLPRSTAAEEPTIRAGDHVYVLVQGQESLTGELPVRADGAIVQPVIGKVDVVGLTAANAAKKITQSLHGIVVDPKVTVAIVAMSPWKISVVGEVVHPGPLEIDASESVLQVLARAGGLTQFANSDGIFVLRRSPVERIRFRYDDLAGGDEKSLGFRLRDGDVVVVQ